MKLRLQHALSNETELPQGLGANDHGRVWWIGHVWFIWTEHGWQQALAIGYDTKTGKVPA